MDKKHPWPQRNVVWEDRGKITVLLSAVKQFFCVMSFGFAHTADIGEFVKLQ